MSTLPRSQTGGEEGRKRKQDLCSPGKFWHFLEFLFPFIFFSCRIVLYVRRNLSEVPQLKKGLIRSISSGRCPVDTGHLKTSNDKLFLGNIFYHLMTLMLQMLTSKENFPVHNLSPLPPVMSPCTSGSSLAPSTLYPSIRLLLKASTDFPN